MPRAIKWWLKDLRHKIRRWILAAPETEIELLRVRIDRLEREVRFGQSKVQLQRHVGNGHCP